MNAISYIKEIGVDVYAMGNLLKLSRLSRLPTKQRNHVIAFAQNHKSEIIAALDQTGNPGLCEVCPAAGYWEFGEYARQGLLCFHYAYFLHQAGRPTPCSITRENCPRKATGDTR